MPPKYSEDLKRLPAKGGTSCVIDETQHGYSQVVYNSATSSPLKWTLLVPFHVLLQHPMLYRLRRDNYSDGLRKPINSGVLAHDGTYNYYGCNTTETFEVEPPALYGTGPEQASRLVLLPLPSKAAPHLFGRQVSMHTGQNRRGAQKQMIYDALAPMDDVHEAAANSLGQIMQGLGIPQHLLNPVMSSFAGQRGPSSRALAKSLSHLAAAAGSQGLAAQVRQMANNAYQQGVQAGQAAAQSMGLGPVQPQPGQYATNTGRMTGQIDFADERMDTYQIAPTILHGGFEFTHTLIPAAIAAAICYHYGMNWPTAPNSRWCCWRCRTCENLQGHPRPEPCPLKPGVCDLQQKWRGTWYGDKDSERYDQVPYVE